MADETNGKAIDIARLDERIKAMKEDFEEHKKSEKDYGVKTDNNVRDLYEKHRMIIECVGNLKTEIKLTVMKVTAIISIVTIIFSAVVGAAARMWLK